MPSVVYISTDLNFDLAEKSWKSFCLNFPAYRSKKLAEKFSEYGEYKKSLWVNKEWEDIELKLTSYSPTSSRKKSKRGKKSIEAIGNGEFEVAFVDLANCSTL